MSHPSIPYSKLEQEEEFSNINLFDHGPEEHSVEQLTHSFVSYTNLQEEEEEEEEEEFSDMDFAGLSGNAYYEELQIQEVILLSVRESPAGAKFPSCCSICLDNHAPVDIPRNGRCFHGFCIKCWEDWLAAAALDKCFKMECPVKNCDAELDSEIYTAFMQKNSDPTRT